MPALGLGVFQTPADETRDAVQAAIACGNCHIDTAAAYGNERQVSEAVRASNLDRSEVFLETKIWTSDYGDDETRHGLRRARGSSAWTRSTHPHAGVVADRRGVTFYRDGSHGSTLNDRSSQVSPRLTARVRRR